MKDADNVAPKCLPHAVTTASLDSRSFTTPSPPSPNTYSEYLSFFKSTKVLFASNASSTTPLIVTAFAGNQYSPAVFSDSKKETVDNRFRGHQLFVCSVMPMSLFANHQELGGLYVEAKDCFVLCWVLYVGVDKDTWKFDPMVHPVIIVALYRSFSVSYSYTYTMLVYDCVTRAFRWEGMGSAHRKRGLTLEALKAFFDHKLIDKDGNQSKTADGISQTFEWGDMYKNEVCFNSITLFALNRHSL
jgi:hypothetical protein